MESTLDFLSNAHNLPLFDWNIKLFGAHMQTVQKGWHVPKKFHSLFEIVIVLEGEQCTKIGQEVYLLHQGDILIIPPSSVHETNNPSSRMTYFCAHFNIDDAKFIMKMIQNCDIYFKNGTEENLILKPILMKWIDIIEEGAEDSFQSKVMAQIILSELLIALDRIIQQNKTSIDHTRINHSKYAKKIAESIKYSFKQQVFHPECSDDGGVQIEQIMITHGLSPNYGYEIFKKVYGFSPRQYLSKLKLKEAQTMLKKPEISMQDISDKLGYKNPSHFSRQFKRWTGLSPLQYRKECYFLDFEAHEKGIFTINGS